MIAAYERKTTVLILDDGTRFEGYSFGAETSTSGEVVFNLHVLGVSAPRPCDAFTMSSLAYAPSGESIAIGGYILGRTNASIFFRPYY